MKTNREQGQDLCCCCCCCCYCCSSICTLRWKMVYRQKKNPWELEAESFSRVVMVHIVPEYRGKLSKFRISNKIGTEFVGYFDPGYQFFWTYFGKKNRVILQKECRLFFKRISEKGQSMLVEIFLHRWAFPLPLYIKSSFWRSGLSTKKYQFSYDHWSQATLSSVSTWMGNCSSVAWVLLLTLKVG